MIEQRARDLTALIRRHRELQRQVHLLDGFRTQAADVARAFSRIEPLVELWRTFNARQIGSVDLLREGVTILKGLQDLQAQYRDDRSYVLGAKRLNIVRQDVPAFAVAFETRLLSAWQQYGAGRAPSVNVEVLQVLGSITPLRAQVQRVMSGLRDLEQRLARLPKSASEIDAFDSAVQSVTQAWDAIDSAHLPPDVLTFLRKAGSGTGAEIDTLTTSVREWLRAHHLTGAFRVRQTTT
jgi:hypothetical protein